MLECHCYTFSSTKWCCIIIIRDSRTDGALQRQQDNGAKKDIDCREDRQKPGKRKEMERREGMRKIGGGTALTPACLFYLGAQHGYRCCAAPSHRDMTASLRSYTIPQTHTHTRSSSCCCLALLLLILSEHLSLSLSLWFTCTLSQSGFTQTHTHPHRHLTTHAPASCPPTIRLRPTGSACCSHTSSPAHSPSLSLINISLPSATQSQYQFVTVY